MSRTWDVLVIPRRGQPFRKKFANRPELVLVLNHVQHCSPERAECYVMQSPLIFGVRAQPATIERLTFRLHMTNLGLAYVETVR